MTPILYGKKLKVRDDELFGQVHADCKWLTLDSNPSLIPNLFLLNITSQKNHPDSHILSKYFRQQGHFPDSNTTWQLDPSLPVLSSAHL